MSTWLDIIRGAYVEVGASPAGEDLSARKTEEGRGKLNRMIGLWNVRRRAVTYLQDLTFAFGTSKSAYTIGPASSSPDFQITGTRPVTIERANVVLAGNSPTEHIPIEIIPVEVFADLRLPGDVSAWPFKLYYKPTFPAGTLMPWPTPTDVSNSLQLFIWSQLVAVEADGIAVDAVLSEGYEEAIMMSLAEKLLTLYPGRGNADAIKKAARAARAEVFSVNKKPPRLGMDSGLPNR